jgi:hypothetical protein
MIRAFYSVLMWLAQPFLRAKLARRGQAEPGYLEAVDERFGRYTGAAPPGMLWLHAVSLGETRAAGVLLAALRAREPGLRVLLTHGTATGRAEGRRLLREGDLQAWQPWDTPGAVRRFLDHFRPRAGVLMETEVWPNLVAQCRARGIPLALANARLSDKSLQQSLALSPLSMPAYAALTAVWAQTAADAKRLRQAGAQVQDVLGNLKFDATPDEAQLAKGRAWRAPTPAVRWSCLPVRAKGKRPSSSSRFGLWPVRNPRHQLSKKMRTGRSARSGWSCRATRSALTKWPRWCRPARPDSWSRRSVNGRDGPARRRLAGRFSLGEMPLYYGWPTWRCWAAALRRWAGRT